MAIISIRVDEDDKELLRAFTDIKGLTISQFMREAAIEKIQDQLDLRFFNELPKHSQDTYTIKELQERLKLHSV